MRWSRYYLYTTREVPADAEVVSHRLMMRAGMIKKVAAGIYTNLPFGWRSFSKLMTIVRRELDACGAVELSMPAVQPAELWRESGRWQRYGKELLRMNDRHGREFCFGPTHEEVITDTVRRDVRSYRQLPLSLYQIQTKFRDEIRPRFGLMRGREFLMKDAYSFHASADSLDETYQQLRDGYSRIFEACGLDYTVVEADTGAIGGSDSHEFMVVADTGESEVVRCPDCGYGANVEKAETLPLEAPSAVEGDLEVVETPGKKTVDEVTEFLGVDTSRLVKTLIYESDKGFCAVAIRGDREVNEVKLGNFLDAQFLVLASDEKVAAAIGAPVGFAGPVGLPAEIPLIVDPSARAVEGFVCGANRADAHYVATQWGRDVEPTHVVDLLQVVDGDPCPRCSGRLELYRGIETGHIFKLGTKYSEALGCVFSAENGKDLPMVMGCYGLGIGRTVAAAIEQNHDDDGIIWPLPLAPFQVLLAALNAKRDDTVRAAADSLYERLEALGVEVLYDDRDERPGVKFKDADLIGIPIRVVLGAKSLADGKVEFSLRRDRERHLLTPDEAVARITELISAG